MNVDNKCQLVCDIYGNKGQVDSDPINLTCIRSDFLKLYVCLYRHIFVLVSSFCFFSDNLERRDSDTFSAPLREHLSLQVAWSIDLSCWPVIRSTKRALTRPNKHSPPHHQVAKWTPPDQFCCSLLNVDASFSFSTMIMEVDAVLLLFQILRLL